MCGKLLRNNLNIYVGNRSNMFAYNVEPTNMQCIRGKLLTNNSNIYVGNRSNMYTYNIEPTKMHCIRGIIAHK